MKTAEQILNEHHIIDCNNTIHSDLNSVLKAVEEYHNQFAPAIKEVEINYVEYQKCPKCDGQGCVSKPPYVAGDITQWSSSSTSHVCDVCSGAKIIPKIALSSSQLKPSDEEIWKQAMSDCKHNPANLNELGIATNSSAFDNYVLGAKAMRDNPESFLTK